MSHTELEHGTIGDGRLSFADGEDVVSCFFLNVFEYYDSDNDEYSRSESPVSKSEERECRICKLEVGSYGQGLIELGCSCKDDLSFAHRQCAETWFKLKGDEVCEICHSVARNVAGGNEMIEGEEDVDVEVVEGGGGNETVGEDRESWWWKRRLVLIIVLICWVSAFLMYLLQSEL
ncbi:unnamed protein product [Microthlaspi erraticum]|uniref:RING-CH-type domain-containing protein n=1 Tax=Microthlaspi erraticum TaxID=1685480 RepID=A0A6D2JQA9_9BRAS|nr:unnamed protein product [Microthlaspi erraticum]